MHTEKLSKNLHRIADFTLTHPHDCAVYLLLGDAPVLIDCGCGKAHRLLKRNLASLGVSPGDIACVIGTHCHYDHLAGIAQLREEYPDLPLALHAADAHAVETADAELTCAGWYFNEFITPQHVDIVIDTASELEIAGFPFEFIHTPGHTPGSISIRTEIDGRTILFCGDCLTPGSHRVLSSYDEWRATLDTLLDTEFDLLLSGHKNQWMGDPFLACLMQPFSKRLGREAFKLLKRNLGEAYWRRASSVYTHVMPLTAKLAGRLTPPKM